MARGARGESGATRILAVTTFGGLSALLLSFACGRPNDTTPTTPTTSAAPSPPPVPSLVTPPAASAANRADAEAPLPAASLPSPCSGKHVAIASALFDARCELPEHDLDGVRNAFEAAPKTALKTTARLLADGRVRFTVANESKKAVVIPLMFHSAVDPFPVTAKKGGGPAVMLHGADVSEPDDPRRPRPQGQYLAITVEPGGEASVELRIVPKKKAESLAHCPPNAKCAPRVAFAPLEAGAYSLKIGGPFVAVRDDVSATLTWTYDPLAIRN